MLRGVAGSLQLSLPSQNRLNLTEPATFLILPFWAFFWDSVFLILCQDYKMTGSGKMKLLPEAIKAAALKDSYAERQAVSTSHLTILH